MNRSRIVSPNNFNIRHIMNLLITMFFMIVSLSFYEMLDHRFVHHQYFWMSYILHPLVGSFLAAVVAHFIQMHINRLQSEKNQAYNVLKEISEALKESEERYKQLIELLPDSIIVHHDGKIVFVNQAASDFIGYTVQELTGQPIHRFIDPQHQEQVNSRLKDVAEKGKTAPLVGVKYVHRDGSLISAEALSRPFLYNGIPAILSVIRDITERNKAQKALEESEKRYYSIFHDNHSVMLLIDPETAEIVDANEAACLFYGYEKHELIGNSIDMINIVGHDIIIPKMRVIFKNHKNYCFNFQHRLSSGEIKDVTVNTGPIYLNGKKLNFSIVHDVTELKRAEDLIRQNEEKYRTLVEQAAIGIFIMDHNGNFVDINPHGCAVLGFTLEDLQPLSLMDLIVDEDLDRAKRELDDMKNGKTIQTKWRLRRRDGTSILLELSGGKLPNGNFQGIFRNITDRQKSEDELRKLSRAIEQSPSSIVITDTDGNIEYVNPHFSRLTGYSLNEVIGKNPRVLKSGEMPPEEYADLWKTITSGHEWRGEFHNRKKNGDLYWESASISPVRDADGRTTHYLAVKEDITELKRATAELHHAKEVAEAANRSKSEFLANISHEIRTPMNGVIGMTELLLGTELNAEQREYLEMVRTSADDLLTLINDILDFSKIEAGKLELETINLDLRALLKQTVETFALAAQNKGLKLLFFFDPHIPDMLVGDPKRLRQIMINLIGNAIKFTAVGEIVIRAQLETETSDGCGVCFSVRDTGIGIPEDKLDRLFKSFSQVDGSTTRKFGGTGLGLAISKNLVELMGGTIAVESVDGQGSNFYFSLPFKQAGSKRNHETSFFESNSPVVSPVQAGRPFNNVRSRILLAEDNPINQKLMIALLKKMNCEVQTATTGLEVLEVYKKGAFDLILMDVQMPEMDGFETTAWIRRTESEGGSHIPIIALTAHVMNSDREKCMDAGMDDFLTKPVRKDELQNVINKYAIGNGLNFEIPRKVGLKPEDPLLDWGVLVGMMDGDEDLARCILDEFNEDVEHQIQALKTAVRQEDCGAVSRIAHRLKGAAGNLGVSRIYELTVQMEHCAKEEKLETVDELLRRLEDEAERLKNNKN